MQFTPKQTELIQMLKRDEFKRINILYGSVRSGKTWITLILFALWVYTMPQSASYLMCAKTITSLRRNCLDLLQDLVGKENFDYSLSAKVGYLFGRKVYLEGANDSRSESKIRGMTLQGAYIDEITLIEKDFFVMLLSRLSEKGAKLFGSTNPDNPAHWLKKEYLDRASDLNLYSKKFVIEDNIFLDSDYVEALKKEYTGVFYNRFILGEFCAGEGLIYDMFKPDIHVLTEEPETEGEYYVSCDFGIQNATVFLLWRKIKDSDSWVLLREWYYSGRDERKQMTVTELVGKGLKGIVAGIVPKRVIVDPSAAALIVEMKKDGFSVKKADNEVLDGISDVSSMLQKERLFIMQNCQSTINEISTYAWDAKKADQGIDAPVKTNDHSMDALRYFVRTMKLVKKEGREKYSSILG